MADHAMSLSALTIADLNTIINHEPRIRDVRIGERLGMAQPLNIRQLIEANRAEMERYGEVFTRGVKTSAKGGRPSTEYWLNEPQTLLLCMLSRTEKAADVRQEVISVYMAYRRGLTAPAKPDSASLREQSEKRRLVAECRKVMGPRAAQAMWRDLGLPVQAPDQNELTLSAIPVGRLENDGRYLVVVHGRTVTEVRELANHCMVDGRSAISVHTFLREFLASDLLPGALDIIMNRLNARAAIAKAEGREP